jgi:DNA-binding response OmpR family regulator
MKILLAEDEPGTRQLLNMYLESKGHTVTTVSDGGAALDAVRRSPPDLLLLDVRMPVLDGWSVLETVRSIDTRLPVLMITALDSANDVVKGLRLGADDYLRKPFDLAELEARIETVLRRARTYLEQRSQQTGALRIDNRSKSVRLGNEEVTLSPKEYQLLQLLASDPGRVFAGDEIVQHIWGKHSRASRDDVKQYIHLLRKKLDSHASTGVVLRTIPGFGYKLEILQAGDSATK